MPRKCSEWRRVLGFNQKTSHFHFNTAALWSELFKLRKLGINGEISVKNIRICNFGLLCCLMSIHAQYYFSCKIWTWGFSSSEILDCFTTQRRFQMSGNRLKLLNLIICTRSSGAAVTFLYISVKILYTVNIVGQIFLLNTFLGNRSKWYGLQVRSSSRCSSHLSFFLRHPHWISKNTLFPSFLGKCPRRCPFGWQHARIIVVQACEFIFLRCSTIWWTAENGKSQDIFHESRFVTLKLKCVLMSYQLFLVSIAALHSLHFNNKCCPDGY